MKALTLHQPWASLIAVGAKTIETRSWSTDFRGPLAIHAGKKNPDEVFTFPGFTSIAGEPAALATRSYYAMLDMREYPHTVVPLPQGRVVASARLVDVVPTEALEWNDVRGVMGDDLGWWAKGARLGAPHVVAESYIAQERERPFGDFSPGRFAFLLADVVALPEPIPCKGRQGLWTLPEEVACRI